MGLVTNGGQVRCKGHACVCEGVGVGDGGVRLGTLAGFFSQVSSCGWKSWCNCVDIFSMAVCSTCWEAKGNESRLTVKMFV